MTEERYVLERKLGAGGMGDVWLATDSLLNRPVAVKFLQATSNPRFKELFLSEARTLAKLQHPNITLIYDAVFDEDDASYYIIMEFVEGRPLSDIVEHTDRPLPFEQTLDITIGILNALVYAHQQGFVHRDIKPDNIIIQSDGVVKITDFGLAALVSLLAEEDSDYVVGTPAYIAPEQVAGETIDGRADLYSLGVTLFEMVTTGRRPFEKDSQTELIMAHVQEAPPSPREFEPTVPLSLERIINRLLAKFPDERYENTQELLDVFNGIRARRRFSQPHLQLIDLDERPLFGRSEQLKQMNALWDEVRHSGQSRLLLLEGEVGIGKSRLAAEFVGRSVIEKKQAVLVGRCDELAAPYAPYAEMLTTIFNEGLVKPATIESQVQHLVQNIPSLAEPLGVDSPAAAEEKPGRPTGGLWQTLSSRVPDQVADPRQAQWQFFTAVQTLLTELGPSVLFFDDADHMDESSQALTQFLVRQKQLPLLILAEVKSHELHGQWLETYTEEERVFIRLTPLATAAVKQLLETVLAGSVSDAMVRIVEKRSRGVPLRVEEVARQLADIGDFYQTEEGGWEYMPPPSTGDLSRSLVSSTLVNAFTRQLSKLSDASKELLQVAAMLEPGQEFDYKMWRLVVGEDDSVAVQAALDEARQRRIVRTLDEAAQRYVFRPPDIALALTADMAPVHRRRLHQKIAHLFAQQEVNPLLVAHHYEQAGKPAESAQYLEEMGRQAMTATAFKQATTYFKRAVNLIETISGYEALGILHREQGAWADSRRAFERALALAEQLDEPATLPRLLNGLAFTLWLADEYREAAAHASRVLKLSNASQLEQATAQSHLGMIAWLLGHLPEADDWCHRAVKLLQDSGEEAKLAEACNRLGLVWYARGKFAQAQQVTNQSLELRQKLGLRWGEAYCLVNLGQINAEQGHFEVAEGHFEAARRIFETIESDDGLMVVDTEQGRMLLLQNKLEDALLLLNRALHQARKIGKKSAYGLADIYLLVAQASLKLKQFDRAQAATDDANKLLAEAGNKRYIALAKAMQAQIYAAQEKHSQAEAAFKEALEMFDTIDYPAGLLRTSLAYARFLAGQGQAAAANAIEKEARAKAEKLSLFL